ncbi:MAG: hypothetical protein FJ088_02945 [Deltaproteobacteria bacterium]|nr:hypothetical protein [Deltaproteobacteria bacterium]
MIERLTMPFLSGVYIGVNAVPDSFLIVDGPYCVINKAFIQTSHDLNCSLISPHGDSRVLFTSQKPFVEEVNSLALDRTAFIGTIFKDVCENSGAGLILTTTFDFHQLINAPVEKITKNFAAESGKPFMYVQSKSLESDWLDGYASFCEAVAGGIPLKKNALKKKKAAIAGYLMDRHEMDHSANIAELGKIFDAFGVELISVWLNGSRYEELKRIEEASVVFSFPYATKAAGIIAGRTGADLIESALPVGLTGTEEFIKKLGKYYGMESTAAQFIEKEAGDAVRSASKHVFRFIAGRRIALALDPYLCESFIPAAGDLGAEILCVVPTAYRKSTADGVGERLAEAGAFFPEELEDSDAELRMKIEPSDKPSETVILLGSYFAAGFLDRYFNKADVILVPLGFPNYLHHPVNESPFLGFGGFRNMVDRISNAVLACKPRNQS